MADVEDIDRENREWKGILKQNLKKLDKFVLDEYLVNALSFKLHDESLPIVAAISADDAEQQRRVRSIVPDTGLNDNGQQKFLKALQQTRNQYELVEELAKNLKKEGHSGDEYYWRGIALRFVKYVEANCGEAAVLFFDSWAMMFTDDQKEKYTRDFWKGQVISYISPYCFQIAVKKMDIREIAARKEAEKESDPKDAALGIFVEKLEKAKLVTYSKEARTRDAQSFIKYIEMPLERFLWKDYYWQENAVREFVRQQREKYNQGDDEVFHRGGKNLRKETELDNIDSLSRGLFKAILETELKLLHNSIGEVDDTQARIFAQCLGKIDQDMKETDKNARLFLNYAKKRGKLVETLAAMPKDKLSDEVNEYCYVIGGGVINEQELGKMIKQAVEVYPAELKKDIASRKSEENVNDRPEKKTSELLVEPIRTDTGKKTEVAPVGEKFGGDTSIASAWRVRLEAELRLSYGSDAYRIREAVVKFLDGKQNGITPFLAMDSAKMKEVLADFLKEYRGSGETLILAIGRCNNAIDAKIKAGSLKSVEKIDVNKYTKQFSNLGAGPKWKR